MEQVFRKSYYLGINNEKEVCVANIELRHPSFYTNDRGNYTDYSKTDFSASFDTYRLVCFDDIDLENYFEGYLDGMDAQSKLDLCDRNDCSPSALPSALAEYYENNQSELFELFDIDTSFTPIYIDDKEHYLQWSSGGQHDIRDEGMAIYSNVELVSYILNMWDKAHLRDVSNISNEIIDTLEAYNDISYMDDIIQRDCLIANGDVIEYSLLRPTPDNFNLFTIQTYNPYNAQCCLCAEQFSSLSSALQNLKEKQEQADAFDCEVTFTDEDGEILIINDDFTAVEGFVEIDNDEPDICDD